MPTLRYGKRCYYEVIMKPFGLSAVAIDPPLTTKFYANQLEHLAYATYLLSIWCNDSD